MIMSQPIFGARADSSGDTLVSGNPERNNMLGAEPFQAQVEVSANEGRIDAFGDQRLVALRAEAAAEIVSRSTGSQCRSGSTES